MESETKMVSLQDLMTLPLQGVVLFAAKCARHVQPFFDEWNNGCGNEENSKSVEAALKLAEDFAKGKRYPHEMSKEEDVPNNAHLGSVAADLSKAPEAQYAAETIAFAADAAFKAARSRQSGQDAPGLEHVARHAAYDAEQRMLLAFQAIQKPDEGSIVARRIFEGVSDLNFGSS